MRTFITRKIKKHCHWLIFIAIASTMAILFWVVPYWGEERADPVESQLGLREPAGSIDWETYQNKEYGFSFKHPEKWQRKEINDQRVIVNQSQFNEIGGLDSSALTVEIFAKPEDLVLTDWLEKNNPINQDTMELVARETKVVDGREGIYRVILDNVAGGHINDLHVKYQDKIYCFELNVRASSPEKQVEYEQTLNDILISFKFAN